MWNDFLQNFLFGFFHVLDIQAYDHILFIILLAVPYLFNGWKPLLYLVSAFTIGHTVSLVLAHYGIVKVSGVWVEFLIPITIAIVAIYNIFTAGRRHNNRSEVPILAVSMALFFGLIHGFGFSSAFRMLASGADSAWLLLIEFALGIESAQLVIVLIVLIINYIFTSIFRFNKKEWTQIICSIVLGIVIPMLTSRWPW